MCLIAWSLNESEAGVDLLLIEISAFFSYVNDATQSFEARSTPVSISFKGQATKHTTVKWSIGCLAQRIWFVVVFQAFLGNALHILQ